MIQIFLRFYIVNTLTSLLSRLIILESIELIKQLIDTSLIALCIQHSIVKREQFILT